jgi:hypothetical protein
VQPELMQEWLPKCIVDVCRSCKDDVSTSCIEKITEHYDMKKIADSDPQEECTEEDKAYATSACYSELLANCKVSQYWLNVCIDDVCSASTAGDPDPLSIAVGYCDNQESLEEEEELVGQLEETTTAPPTKVADTPGWTNNDGNTCDDYKTKGWCKDGKFVAGYEWKGEVGTTDSNCNGGDCALWFLYPSLNCAVCGRDENTACYEFNTDYKGNDLSKIKVDTPVGCQTACQEEEACKFWTSNAGNRNCILKSSDAGRKTKKHPGQGQRVLISGPKYCEEPLHDELTLDCEAGTGVMTASQHTKCIIPASFEQCENFAQNLPAGKVAVDIGAWGNEFPKFCFYSLMGTEVHMWWNNNTGDGDGAPKADGHPYKKGSCCDTSARRICCGDWALPVTPAPSPVPPSPPNPDGNPNDPPLNPNVDTTLKVERPPNPAFDLCQVFGDPHIQTFDAAGTKTNTVDFYAYGKFWLVKSSAVWIQGHYRSIDLERPGLGYLTKIAVGGPFLQGNRLMIEGTSSGSQVWWNEGLILEGTSPATHRAMNGAVRAERSTKGKAGKTNQKLKVQFPDDVAITVVSYVKPGKVTFLNAIIKMRQVLGQDGQCGNFNLDSADDTEELLKQRGYGYPVGPSELLIPG